jgi:hypothetical protein
LPYAKKEDKAEQMRKYRKTQKENHQKEVTLAYWAGIVDGEGSIYIIKALRKAESGCKSPNHQVYLSIGMCCREIIYKMKEYFDMGHIFEPKNTRCNCKQSYYYVISNNQAISVIKLLLPYLIVKKEQARLAIEFDNKRSRCMQKGISKKIRKVSEAEITLREQYYQKMKVLNS